MSSDPTHQEVIEKAKWATGTALAQARARMREADAEAALALADNIVRLGALLRIFNVAEFDLDRAALTIGCFLGAADAPCDGLAEAAAQSTRRRAALDALATLRPYLNPALLVAALVEESTP